MTKIGYKLSEETKRKISEAQKGKRPSDETRRKLSESHKGHKHSEETKRKMSETQKGRPGKSPSAETRAKISKAMKGRIMSIETRRRMSISAKNISQEARDNKSRAGKNKPPPSDETRKKMAEAQRGKVQSQETIDKRRVSRAGYSHSEETKLKIGKGQEGKVYSEEAKTKISEKAIERVLSGKDFHIKGYFNSLKAGRQVGYRSISVELRLMQLLENCGWVVSWQFEKTSIKYETADGYYRRTVPDFLVNCLDGSRLCIEGKGNWLVEKYLTSEKYQATIDWCDENGYTFILVTDFGLDKGWKVPEKSF